MTQKIINLASILLLTVFIISSSCNKDKKLDTQSAEDNAKGALVVADAFAFSDSNASGKKMPATECYTVTQLDNAFEITFYNCDYNGIVRNGTIKASLSANWGDGSLMTIEFINFTFGGNSINGTISAGYRISVNGIFFELNARNMKMIFDNGESFSWESSLNYSLKIDGIFPVFEIYGFSNGVNREGETFELEANAVVFDRECLWPVSGTYKMVIDGNETIIDFDEDGTGQCNTIINVSNKYNSVDIDLQD